MKLSLSLDEFNRQMTERGWVVFEAAVAPDLLGRMADDLEAAWDICRAIQVRNGVATDADRTVHHLIGIKPSFLEYLDGSEALDPYFEAYFGGKYVLNSFGGAINSQGRTSYAQRIHRDIRSYSGDMPLLLNTLVMLDAFTAENGATYMLSGSHKAAEKPSDKDFYARAERAAGPAGSVLVFNSNVWHAGGNNTTDRTRRSVTPMYARPFIKPQFDYPRVLGYDAGVSLTPYARQVIGFNARIPANLDEWYQPPERRMYRGDQG
jgi:hypothetical protein